MTDLFDTHDVRDDPAHWDAVASRVTTHAMQAGRRGRTLALLGASRVGWLAASALFAAALGFAVTRGAGNDTMGLDLWKAAIAPSDDVGGTLVGSDRPPSIDLLLAARIGGAR